MSKGLRVALVVFGVLAVVGGSLAAGFMIGRASNWSGLRLAAPYPNADSDFGPGLRPGAMMGQYGRPDCFGWGSMTQFKGPNSMGPWMMQKNRAGNFTCPYHVENDQFPGRMRPRMHFQYNRPDGAPDPCPFWDENRQEFPPNGFEGE
ncbi:MAG: hypothetical protein HPY59_06535 [Anaerolineae bacterium]|nr:hypothetical protein [Anaerolineae bacterium]